MSTTVLQGAPQTQAVAPALTTPQILKTGLVGIWISTLLLMTAVIAGARSHRDEMKVIGIDSAPSIIHSLRIRTALADMDAHAASESRDVFEDRRKEAVSAIVDAAKNITYKDEREPIEILALGLSTYTAQVQAARDRHDIAAWREAQKIMDDSLLPNADALDKANRNELDKAYEAQKGASRLALTMLILGGLLTGAALISVQIFTAARMRRVVNPFLFLATVGAWIFVVYAGQRYQASDYHLKVAKKDAFESIHSLWQARATAYSANGDLARAALDPAQRTSHEAAFRTRTGKVRGFLADELRNITFEGEEEAARETAKRFDEYQSAKTPAALKDFDDALDKTLQINERAFNEAVNRGYRQDLANFEITAPIWAAAICLLAWLGMRPRIREYSM